MYHVQTSVELGQSLSRSAYQRVFKVWSAEFLPGFIQAIMMILETDLSPMKESLKAIVSLALQNGICPPGTF